MLMLLMMMMMTRRRMLMIVVLGPMKILLHCYGILRPVVRI